MANGDSNGNGNGTMKIITPWLSLQGPGMFLIVLVLIVALIYNFNVMQDTIKLTQLEHRALVGGLNDLFIAVMTPPEVKANLPPVLKRKLEEKTLERATEKVKEP